MTTTTTEKRSRYFRTARHVHTACLVRNGYVQRCSRGLYEASFWSAAEQEWHHSGKVSRDELLAWANCLEVLRQPI